MVATSEEGAAHALSAARSFGDGLSPTLRLLVPHFVPYPESLDSPSMPVQFVADRFKDLAVELSHVEVQICVCRPAAATLAAAVPRNAVVVVGGVRGWLRPSREERLAAALATDGRRVLFVDY